MIRRLLSAGVGAALMGILTAPAHVIAAPPEDQAEIKAFIATLTTSQPAPLFRLRPTARRTLAGSLLFGIHPGLGLLPTDKVLDVPGDHPQPTTDDFLSNMPKCVEISEGSATWGMCAIEMVDWWKWLLSISTARLHPPVPEQNEGYVQTIATGTDFAYRVVEATDELFVAPGDDPSEVAFNFGNEVSDQPSSEDAETPPSPTIEVLPMPHEDSDLTCPYLRQQVIDRHASQIADPEIGRDVLDNLERLKDADNLLELAKDLASCGFVTEAMMCCDIAAKRCPGSPCAARAVDTMNDLARGIPPRTADTEEDAEPQPDGNANFIESYYKRAWDVDEAAEPGVEPMVCGLMKACHLLMSQGMQHQAAELARQAYALDPRRVTADPLIYKMHLLAETPPTPAGASEESEPQTCPYCPSIGKPIREIVPEKKKSKKEPTTFLVPPLPSIDYEVVPALDGALTEPAGAEEASEKSTPEEDLRQVIRSIRASSVESPIHFDINTYGELRMMGDVALGDAIYHWQYSHGSMKFWETTDASK